VRPRAFASLSTSDEVASLLESFVCRVYHRETKLTTLAALRYWMFSTKQAVGERLPPTQGAFLPALPRVNFQAMIWEKDNQKQPKIPSAVGHGWITEDGTLKPVMCELPCVPVVNRKNLSQMFVHDCYANVASMDSNVCVRVQPMTTWVTIHPVTVNQSIHLKTMSVKMSNYVTSFARQYNDPINLT